MLYCIASVEVMRFYEIGAHFVILTVIAVWIDADLNAT